MAVGDELFTRSDVALLKLLLADITVPVSAALFRTRLVGGRRINIVNRYDTVARLMRWFVDNKLTLTAGLAATHAACLAMLAIKADWVLIDTGGAVVYQARAGDEALTAQDLAVADFAASALFGPIVLEDPPAIPADAPPVTQGMKVVPQDPAAAETLDVDEECSAVVIVSDDGAAINTNVAVIHIGDSTITVADPGIRPGATLVLDNIRNLNEIYCVSGAANQDLMWWAIR